MPKFKYCFKNYDPLTQVRASAREIDVSPKAAREVCTTIKGYSIIQAKKFLKDVIEKKQIVPFRRYKKKIAHKNSQFKFYSGRYPVKTAKIFLKVVENLEANAEFKGLESDKIILINATSLGGMKIKRYTPRAYGRSSPKFDTLVHVEIVGREVI